MKIKIFQLIDWTMLLCVLLLSITGILFIYSSAVNQQGLLVTKEYSKQIVWFSLGLVLLVAAAIYDYRNFERYVIIAFGTLIVLLILLIALLVVLLIILLVVLLVVIVV